MREKEGSTNVYELQISRVLQPAHGGTITITKTARITLSHLNCFFFVRSEKLISLVIWVEIDDNLCLFMFALYGTR